MLFGPQNRNKSIFYTFLIIIGLTFLSCNQEDKFNYTFIGPEQGQNIKSGDTINIQVDAEKDAKIDSVIYLLDNQIIATKTDVSTLKFPTTNLPLGFRLISAVLIKGNLIDTITTNIVLKASKAPLRLSYQVVNSFPHQTNAYTEGLSYIDKNILLESTGEKGASNLKYVDLKTGKDLKSTKLGPEYFGEGSLKIGDKVIMLTWQENLGFIFDAKTFKQLGTFPYQTSREGWGLTFDGKQILRTDGSNRIWRMNAATYREEGYLEVYDNNGPVDSLNELEFIDGKIYANVYLSTKIIKINPNTGQVEAELDLAALVPQGFFKTSEEIQNNVLNGIAWDQTNKRLFVTGKKWPKLYQISLKE